MYGNETDRLGFNTTWQGRRRRVCLTIAEEDYKVAKAKGIKLSFALGVGLRRLANPNASSQENELRELQNKVSKIGERLSNTSQRLYDAEARLNRLN